MALTSERFELGPRIGRGSAGDVHTARDKLTNDVVAVKLVDLEEAEDEVEDIQREISYLVQCSSPFVPSIRLLARPRSTRLAIAMEYMAGGSVADLIKDDLGGPLSESACAVICRDLLYALDYLHGEGKIHRDVKCANVLLTAKGEIRLADFGVAGTLTQTLGGNKRRTFTGTPFWMAPEVIQAHESDGYNSNATSVAGHNRDGGGQRQPLHRTCTPCACSSSYRRTRRPGWRGAISRTRSRSLSPRACRKIRTGGRERTSW